MREFSALGKVTEKSWNIERKVSESVCVCVCVCTCTHEGQVRMHVDRWFNESMFEQPQGIWLSETSSSVPQVESNSAPHEDRIHDTSRSMKGTYFVLEKSWYFATKGQHKPCTELRCASLSAMLCHSGASLQLHHAVLSSGHWCHHAWSILSQKLARSKEISNWNWVVF